ncbi:8-oxo-dGTP diphosphatase [Cribrihabitans marinus]|uniref:8-oxo-dGTP diphosphatase n=1 Tax=Cribrihabitans marinus TaxID=1227549 RepID=A0A1H7DXA2_9RHOB|nr:NUDIX hydrolase [Cribrihabitans marinus]GGH40516.1 NUDIX domain-containing protein [Cribrihabitans marinus]SEK06004.1 8-oxo-dGTP diphosphatase [Cribrihabitans marinus]
MEFSGAKLALFLGADLLVIRRDNRPDIPFPDHLDLPGGGREMGESPEACVLRETAEEVGLQLDPAELIWSRNYVRRSGRHWLFAAHRPAGTARDVRFGDEGQGWMMMSPEAFMRHPMTVPFFPSQLQDYLDTT